MKKIILILGSVFILCGCGKTIDEYSSSSCYVVIHNESHLNHVLSTAMNSMTPGIFCQIRGTTSGGAPAYSLLTNDGQTDQFQLNGDEQRMTRIIGKNNGIIVGYSNLGNGFYGYDRECPNCYVIGKSHPLTMKTNGQAVCDNCNRAYDLNNRGFIVSGDDGDPLTRYRASSSGPNGVLIVQNQQ